MKVIIIEDETHAVMRLEKLLKKIDNKIIVLAILGSVKESVQWLRENPEPELIFMDINLEDGNCFKIFEKVHVKSPVIFITAFEDFMLNAFKVNSIDYLLKPVNSEDLEQSIAKFKELQKNNYTKFMDSVKLLELLRPASESYKTKFMITIGHKVKFVRVDEIAYFYYDERTTNIITDSNQNYVIDHSLDELTELLDPGKFFRVNRQFIVKIGAIENIILYPKARFKLTLKPSIDKDVIVSSYRSAAFRNWLDS